MIAGRRVGFRGRLLTAMLALVLGTSFSIAAAFMVSAFQEEESRAHERLNVAGDVVQEVLARRAAILFTSLNVLVEDFGFKSAIATQDEPTMRSMLENHSQRFNSPLAIVTDRNGHILANLQGLPPGSALPFPQLMEEANRTGAATALINWNDQAFQALMVPVQAPGLRAWLVMGQSLDDRFAETISRLTGVDVIFRSTSNGTGAPSIYGHTVTLEQAMGSADVMPATTGMIGNQRYFIRIAQLGGQDTTPVQALLLLDRQTALSAYYRLAFDLLWVVIGALTVAGLIALALARALGRPVLELAGFAGSIGDGKAAAPPGIRTRGELKTLEQSLVSMQQRISHREHRIRHDANHDSLTGLPNRRAMERQVRQQLANNQQGWLLTLSITGLKEISETLGFEFGDNVLIASGLRLRGTLPPHQMLARTGGNEFMVAAPDTDETTIRETLAKLRAALESAVTIKDTPVSVELAAALLELPKHAHTVDDVRRRTSLTLERARKHETRTATYLEGGEEHHLRELRIIRDLQPAMANREIRMVYQPKIRFDTATLTQVEALVRWQHPELGFLNPEEFIQLAERSGQIHQLTDYIIRSVERDGREWYGRGMPRIGVAINLSTLDLTNANLPALISTIFADWPRPLNMLTFEITETAAMVDMQASARTLERLRQLGAKLSVDDFGTGDSSLAQMRQLPVQELKIDKSFVMKLDSTPQDQLIVKSTVDMAHGLGLTVVAEGIENEDSWRLLQSWGCEMAQGYFLGRPMSPEGLVDWHVEFQQKSGGLLAAAPLIQ
ncbi:MAG: diguanylate phosphodiesterase [Alteromonadaceae bacterium]|nr:diguanylate phosphodiesterase [Alteromonadaceae bacterium]MBH86812.1 diguanylate phosphodiesterase [Alteromonadaceae bacterium]|tara:strand:- start:9984 stop:12341 length:2358 start_codon:yes stop_codon:yes gene_type:complete